LSRASTFFVPRVKTWMAGTSPAMTPGALPAGKPIPSHFNEFSSTKLLHRFYRICAFVP
jgi:hypothetical protein